MIKLKSYILIISLSITSCSTVKKKKVVKKEDYSLVEKIDLFSESISQDKCTHEYEVISYKIFSLNNDNFSASKMTRNELESVITKTKEVSKIINKNLTILNPKNVIENHCIKNLKTTKTAFHILNNYLIDLHYWKTKDSKMYKGHVYNNFRINNVIKRSLLKRRPASVHSFKKKVVRRQKKLGLPLTPVEMQSLY